MKPWQRTALIFLAALAMWTGLHKLAVRYGPPQPPTYAYTHEATAFLTCAAGSNARQATIEMYETHIPPIRSTLAALEATAQALQTAVATPAATWTPDVLPTATPTPTTQPLCRACQAYGRDCPSGYVCAQCRAGVWRCVPSDGVNAGCQKCLSVADSGEWPGVVGLATWYEDSVYVASGDYFYPDRMTCAVDVSLWPWLAGKVLRITNLETGAWVDVVANDCGHLYKAGMFAPRTHGAGFVSATQGYYIVADLSPAAMRVISPDGETVPVSVTLAPRDLTNPEPSVE